MHIIGVDFPFLGASFSSTALRSVVSKVTEKLGMTWASSLLGDVNCELGERPQVYNGVSRQYTTTDSAGDYLLRLDCYRHHLLSAVEAAKEKKVNLLLVGPLYLAPLYDLAVPTKSDIRSGSLRSAPELSPLVEEGCRTLLRSFIAELAMTGVVVMSEHGLNQTSKDHLRHVYGMDFNVVTGDFHTPEHNASVAAFQSYLEKTLSPAKMSAT